MSVEVIGLVRRFGHTAALDGVSLAMQPGEFVALLGPSGSGKSTLLRVLAGLDFAEAGVVRIEGRDMAGITAQRRGIGVVFQNYALFRHMTVARNVAFGLEVRPARQRPKRAQIADRVRRLLALVQIPELAERFPDQISGGQRQRVALARALAIEPRLLLLDEPFGALDARVRRDLRRWVRGLHDQLGITTILVTHDQEEAMELADRVAVMERGRIAQFDTPAGLLARPASPFVAGFIGEAAQLAGEVREGVLRFAADGLPPLCVALPDGPATAFVQAGDLLAEPGASTTVVRSARQSAGSVVRLIVDVSGQLFDAAPVPGTHMLVQGDTCRLRIAKALVFGVAGRRATAAPIPLDSSFDRVGLVSDTRAV